MSLMKFALLNFVIGTLLGLYGVFSLFTYTTDAEGLTAYQILFYSQLFLFWGMWALNYKAMNSDWPDKL